MQIALITSLLLLLSASSALRLPSPVASSPIARPAATLTRRCVPVLMAKKKAGGGGGGGGKDISVVLTADVKGQGRKGELINVKPAYAQNFIVSKGLGKVATPEILKEIEKAKAAADADAAAALVAAKELAAKLEAAFEAEGAVIKKKVGPNGDIFGSVTGGDLSEHIASRGFKVDKKAISVASVTSVGSAAATLSLHKQVSMELKFEVVSA